MSYVLPSQWTLTSWECSHICTPTGANILHSRRDCSVPEQWTSSKKIGPDPGPKRGSWYATAPNNRRLYINNIYYILSIDVLINETDVVEYTSTLESSQLSADHLGISCAEKVITNSPPSTVNANLYSAFTWILPIH